MVGLRGRLHTGASGSLAGVVAAIILGACALLPAASHPPESASPAPSWSAAPPVSPASSSSLPPTGSSPPADSPLPTSTPLAGPWLLHATLAPTGAGEWAALHGETFLADGRVLVLWADIGDLNVDIVEGPSRSSLYDPQTDTWTELVPPWDYEDHPPGWLSLVGLADGSALAVLSLDPGMGAAGTGTQSALFDPQQGTWLPPVDVPVDDPISARDGVMLGDGRVLVFGVGVATTYLFDPASGLWETGPALPFDDLARSGWITGRSATVLDDGSVLALAADGHAARLPAGGTGWFSSGRADVGDGAYLTAIPGGAIALGGTVRHRDYPGTPPDPRTAVYRADTNHWSRGSDVPEARPASVGVLLPDSQLLVAGGSDGSTGYSCVNLAVVLNADALTWQSMQPMPVCLAFGIGRLRADGSVLIVGEGKLSYEGPYVYSPIQIMVLTYLP